MKAAEGLTPEFWKDGRFGEETSSRVLFGQTRDDVEVERWLIEQHGAVQRALVITSGGCAPLTLLDVVSDEILSADINPAQNRLAELKMIAWRESAEEFESLLCRDGREAFARIRPHLSPHTAGWWDAHSRDLRAGLLHCGRLDHFSAFMRSLFFLTVVNSSSVSCSSTRWIRSARPSPASGTTGDGAPLSQWDSIHASSALLSTARRLDFSLTISHGSSAAASGAGSPLIPPGPTPSSGNPFSGNTRPPARTGLDIFSLPIAQQTSAI